MGRRAHFQHKDFIEAAIGIIAERGLGGLTISALSRRTGSPVGSMYHRFPSRNALIGELWLTIVEYFQKEYLKRLGADGLQAALYALQWVRERPNEARVLLLHKREDFMSGKWPIELQNRARILTEQLNKAMLRFIRKQFGGITPETIDRTRYILGDAPGGIIRRYLENGKIPPESVDELIHETYAAVMKKKKKRIQMKGRQAK
jgi:AcrR family transcriptional regulator